MSLPQDLSAYIRQVMMGVEDMLPAVVLSYDDALNRVELQPLVMLGTLDGSKQSRTKAVNIPVFRYGAGGFFMRFPVVPGDFGWIKACDRDISLIMQSGGNEDWPNTERLHSFEDAMFYPDTLKDWIIDDKNKDAFVIQSLDGDVCLAIHKNKMEIDAAVTNWAGDVNIKGNLAVDGDITSTGNVNADGEIKADAAGAGVALTTHLHTGNLGAPTSPPTAGT